MTFQALLDEIRYNIGDILDSLHADVAFSVGPAKSGFGDASCNVAFLLSGHLKKSPREIAYMISEMYSSRESTLVAKSLAHDSGYVNFVADWKKLCPMILRESGLDDFGSVDLGNNSTVVVEHTSVNPNKALHIGHVRNIVIGDVVSRILQKANYRVRVLNYVDDSGLQVADIVIGLRHFGFPEEPPEGEKFDHYCGDKVYVQTSAMYGDDPKLQDLRKKTLLEIEDGASETAQFASGITRRVLSSQLETCWNLGVTYDCLNFESDIIRSGLWQQTFEKLKALGLARYVSEGDNAGCWVIPGHRNEKDKVLVRSNGTATYIAKDIPYAAWKAGLVDDPFAYVKYEKSQPGDRTLWQSTLVGDAGHGPNFTGQTVITVIDSRQTNLQKIIIDLISKLMHADNAYMHLGYESVTLSTETARTLGLDTGGKQAQMSGRKGLYVNADSVYDLLKTRITGETTKRHPEMDSSEIAQIAHDISVGTLRYEMIKQDLDKMIVFDLTKSLSLEGDTSSYIQYTHARASRIIEKSGSSIPADPDCSILSEPAELYLVRQIGMFDIHVRDAAGNLSPKVIARYCHDLAVSFNEFYEKVRVLGIDNNALASSRLYLVGSFRITLQKALNLLGIPAPAKM